MFAERVLEAIADQETHEVILAELERSDHVRAVGECKIVGSHEEALYLEELRGTYRETRDPAILSEVWEEHGILPDEWEGSL